MQSICLKNTTETERTWECEGEEVMMEGRGWYLSFHLWRQWFISFHFSAMVTWFHLFCRSGKSKTADNLFSRSALIPAFFFWKTFHQHYAEHQGAPLKKNKNALQVDPATFASGGADLILRRTLKEGGLFKMYKWQSCLWWLWEGGGDLQQLRRDGSCVREGTE